MDGGGQLNFGIQEGEGEGYTPNPAAQMKDMDGVQVIYETISSTRTHHTCFNWIYLI
ncbi:MAG: hypothetical protein LBH79_09315 [Nitrososphaerota archaeon]|jgi:hypothetical protein|nr:hypothetical protein [Nitrososphaerota archaeon]